ncbi:uncharacterized protein LOC114516016 [Dendronephthya gigantea]|uniref:uncharacterized protein LOC114516016 n=1 Tax=Dendronephthya gigantea TaxID=151771 RepID=UPI00106D0A3F|nr:uncharacterized protein LOC114516016 [Dendronephthya gigantea]
MAILVSLSIFLLKILTVIAKPDQPQTSLRRQTTFVKVNGYYGGESLPPEHIIARHAVYSQVECSLKCLQATDCVGYNYRLNAKKYAENCQISKYKTVKSGSEYHKIGEWTFYQDLGKTLEKENEIENEKASDATSSEYLYNTSSCNDLRKKDPQLQNGYYRLKTFQAYCDLLNDGWTLIARFSNNDSKNWILNGKFWYDRNQYFGKFLNPAENNDMISEAFWKVKANEFKITRSDDSSHTALLQTTSNCLQGGTFRSKITSYGNFRNGAVWASDQCRGNCPVIYGGQYQTTAGFEKHSCNGNIQSSNYIGFWCDWDSGDGAVMMIGGGGNDCDRADHGVGITEEGAAKFGVGDTHHDYGNIDNFVSNAPTSYSLNLWVR